MDDDARMPRLSERNDGFNYGYLMRCRCGEVSPISGADYYAEMTRDAHMPCQNCQGTMNFGPAVAAMRDPNDPALDNEQINRLAWYHTSTTADWPSATYANDNRPALVEAARHFRLDPDHAVKRQLDKALHVGTYEAAIENMQRRMHDQADADSTFYLHRVALRVDPSRINPSYRDENDEAAAQVTNDDLRREGVEAIRYLNVHEAIGSLSLAVIPETIVAVQSITLPVERLGTVPNASLTEQVDALEARLAELTTNRPDTARIKSVDLRMMQLGVRPDPEGIGAKNAEHDDAVYELWRKVEQVLVEYYLGGVSPVVIADLADAMRDWRRSREPSVHEYANHFASFASLLTCGDEVRASVARQAARHIDAPDK